MRLFLVSLTVFFGLFCSCKNETSDKEYEFSLIPKPQQMVIDSGNMQIDESSTLFVDDEFKITGEFLQTYLSNGAGIELKTSNANQATIRIIKDAALPKEGYTLRVSAKNIEIKAADNGGAFYGIQSLRQLLPPELERINSSFSSSVEIPQIEISDAPKFSYRGMHLDVGRHFFPKEFIKEYIANMALFKMNYFHWHLTEDQGWRIEIKQYPRLTTHAAYRDETLVGHYNDSPQQFDGERYGGFYTQDEIKEVVAFAAMHNVTVIPEIEMPGHAQAAVSAYPELGCTGEQVQVATKWGVFENIYCPNQKTFAFLKNVLTEVMDLFPGEYIHIGGDEAPKEQWKNCGHCQKLIAEHDLKDEHGLQSYFIKEIEAFVNSKGKKIIGWDEILEGGLAPNATVMSWRGTQGGIEAAKAQHQVIMTPTSHAYFDYYQADNPDEPLAIGGFLPLKKVYSFNPIPKELSEEEAKYVLGAQGNVWTEYMKTEDKVEYMAYPRMLAMSEVVWSGASEDVESDYSDFLGRLEPFMERLDVLNINYANHLYEIEGKVIKKEGQIFYELTTPTDGKEIRYVLNDSEEQSFDSPIPVSENIQLTANVYKNGEKVGTGFSEEISFHKGITATAELNVDPHRAYSAGGKEALLNGIQGSDSRYGDKEWLGFWGDDVEIAIDFPEETEIDKISTRFYNANGQWIYAPKEAIVEIVRTDGSKVNTQMTFSKEVDGIQKAELSFFEKVDKVTVNAIVLRIPSYGVIPEGLQGAGNNAWIFIDEIIIE